MTLQDLKRLELFQTRELSAELNRNENARAYAAECLQRLYAGDYGEMPAEDTDANNAELASGEGRIIARYAPAFGLQDDIYIIAYFSASTPGTDSNNIMIMYRHEY